MGWFSRSKKPDIVALLDEHAERGDATAIMQACNTLNGLGSMLFGIPLRDISNPDALKEPARKALDVALTRVPIAQAENVIAAASRATVPIDLAPLRARLAAVAEPSRAKIVSALAGMTDVDALIAAFETLETGGEVAGIYYGRSWPNRDALLDVARKRIADTIAKLPPDRARAAILGIRRAHLGIPVDSAAVSHVDSDEPIDDAIEATLDDDDPETFAVLGDWLAERGHVRGELIALHLRAETDPALVETASKYVSDHAKALLGVLAGLRSRVVWRRGFIDDITLIANDEVFLVEQVAALFDHPSGRRVRTLGLVAGYDEEIDSAIRAVADRLPPHLRRLVVGNEQLARIHEVDLAPVWSQLPQLRSLLVRGAFKAAPIRHAQLARLQIETVALSEDEAHQIATAELPALEHLDVWFGGSEEYDDDGAIARASLADATAILMRTDLPRLTHLGLQNATFTDDLCAALASTPMRLVELDLSLGTMSQAGADALIAAARNFPKLEKLFVADNYLDEATVTRLRQTFRTVVSDPQREDYGDRYPAVYE
ncbi:MAG TPA: hypothetical protein VL326_11700 [Kofleriaceae bacterium]|nr:hypothetical protein [Kofleriaceae bacterium]